MVEEDRAVGGGVGKGGCKEDEGGRVRGGGGQGKGRGASLGG